MNTAEYINISVNIAGVVFCLLILFFVASSEYGKLKRSRIFSRIIIVHIVGTLATIIDSLLNIHVVPEADVIKKIMIIIIPLGGPLILLFFIDLILTIFKEKTAISKAAQNASYIAKALCVIDIAITLIFLSVIMLPMTSPSHYSVSSEHNAWFVLSQTLSLGCMVIGAVLFTAYKKFLSIREFLTLSSYIVFPIAAILIELFFLELTLITFSITLVIFIYYASIQSELSQKVKQKELELTESKIAIMLTQIQPHFLHNALSAIAHLCTENPERAKKASLDFSAYLRSNMESLSNKGLIGVEKELNHVKGYLDLERAIYGNALNVVYNVESDNFSLPPLTIQPIVENAVKHGIGEKEGGGTITISVAETDSEHLVVVSDDGVGYDVSSPRQDNCAHIGIENVRQRIKEQCDGTLEISSKTGKGTTAVIKIPKTNFI